MVFDKLKDAAVVVGVLEDAAVEDEGREDAVN